MFIFQIHQDDIKKKIAKPGFNEQIPKADEQKKFDLNVRPVLIVSVNNNLAGKSPKKTQFSEPKMIIVTTDIGVAKEKTRQTLDKNIAKTELSNINYSSDFSAVFKDASIKNASKVINVSDAIKKGLELVDDDTSLSKQQKEAIKTEIRQQNTIEGIANVFKSHGYDDLARIFTNWVKQNYEKRLKDETDKLLRPSSPKVVMAPNIISDTSKTALAEKARAENIEFEPSFGHPSPSFADFV